MPSRMPQLLLAGVICTFALAACDDDVPPANRVSSLNAVSGDAQQGAVATTLPAPVVARAVDAGGRAVSGARLEWTVMSGGGTVLPASETTDQSGEARAAWTLGTGAGQQTLRLQIGVATLVFTATAQPGPATTVTLTPAAFTFDALGSTTTLTVDASDTHGNVIANPTPTWTSLNSNIATVNGGIVTSVAPGTTNIRATLDGTSDEAEITVAPVPATIIVTPANPQLNTIGATVQLQAAARDRNDNPVAVDAGEFTWLSSNPNVVSVSPTGLATAVAAGSAQASASIGTVSGETTVSVVQTIATLLISPRVDTVSTAQPTAQYTVTATDASGNAIVNPTVTWTSSAPGIATVTGAGLASGISNGTAFIRAVSGAVRDSATIVVRLNTVPIANADTFGAIIDTPRQIAAPGVLANDSLGIPAGAVASFGGGSLGGSVISNAAGSTVNFGTGGSLTVNANGSLAFTPSAGFSGEFTFQYLVQNALGASTGTVVIEVGSATVAADDNYAASAGVTLVVDAASGLLANDDRGFPLGSIISIGGGSLPGNSSSYPVASTLGFGVGGFLRVEADGSFSFTPPQNPPAAFTFLYRLSNGSGFTEATVTININ